MREAGDLPRHAERSLIKLITDGNLVLSESVKFQAEQLRQSLRSEAGDEKLERLLIDHVVLCWLELHYVRTAAAQPQQHLCDSRFWEQRFERASSPLHIGHQGTGDASRVDWQASRHAASP